MSTATVKSAERALQVLDYFSLICEAATVAQVSSALEYPQSSTSVLLKTMEAGGYLSHDPSSRTYKPTIRVMFLGSWLQAEVFCGNDMLKMLRQTTRQPRMSAKIGVLDGALVRCLLSIRSPVPLTNLFKPNKVRPACISAMGKILLTNKDSRTLKTMVRHSNLHLLPETQQLRADEVVDEIEVARRTGWAQSRDYPLPGISSIAIRLPSHASHPPIALAFAVTSGKLDVERDNLIDTLRSIATQCQGN